MGAYKGLPCLFTGNIPDGAGGFEIYAAMITDVLDVPTQSVELRLFPMEQADDPLSFVSPRFNVKTIQRHILFSSETPGTAEAVGHWGNVIPA